MSKRVLENHNLTFPRTPFEVFRIHDTEYGDSGKRFQIFVAGEWNCWEHTIAESCLRLNELQHQYRKYPRPNPDWEGWSKVDRLQGGPTWDGCTDINQLVEEDEEDWVDYILQQD